MTETLPDFDDVYRGRDGWAGAGFVPWNIGVPQPAIAPLLDAAVSPVLDVGCGVGVTTIVLARAGHEVVGVDISAIAIEQARRDAAAAGVDAEFRAADVSEPFPDVDRFATVVDCTLFHALPVERRDPYLAAAARAARPGAVLHVLAFDARAPLPPENRPHAVTAEELRAATARHWSVDSVEEATILVLVPPGVGDDLPRDDAGRIPLPAFLLRAHLPG